MKNTVILIRCIEFSAPVAALTELLQRELPDVRLIAVPDLINKDSSKHESILAAFPIEAAPLTKRFVDEHELPFSGPRTGWLCGDYVFYRALDFAWDYAWIVEPDVCFLNGSVKLLSRLSQFNHDLVATNYGRAREAWTWFDPIQAALPHMEVYSMTFPLVRMSRQMATSALGTRRKAASSLPDGIRTPNDESVVATTASHNGHSVLDMKKLFPPLFKYWTTTLKLPIDDIAKRELEPRIVHSAVGRDHFMRYLSLLWYQMTEGNPHGKTKLVSLINYMSADTIEEFVTQISEKRLAGDHSSHKKDD